MREHRPSRTAAFVAALRGLGALLPKGAQLIDDPFGARFAGHSVARLDRIARRDPRVARRIFGAVLRPLLGGALWLQLRTRVLDEALLRFAREGGTQVLLLGAGYDCRAWRFAAALAAATVFEVDHPATQARKRRILDELQMDTARARFLAWDFERQSMAELPDALAAIGLDSDRRTLTIWEGVTPYLTPVAIESSVAAVRELSAPGSTLAMSYFDVATLKRPSLLSAAVRSVGEPHRFGWDPARLPSWLAERGFSLLDDRSESEFAIELLPPSLARRTQSTRRVAIAQRLAELPR